MREPTLTIMPPNSRGSTLMSIATRAPTARRNCSVKAACRVSLSGCATVTSAVTSPRRSASFRKIGLDHLGHREQATVARDDTEKIAGQRRQPGALGQRRDRLALLVARQDRAAHETHQIGAVLQHRAQFAQIAGDDVEPAALVGQFEQRGRITFSQAGNAGSFGSQWRAVPNQRADY